MDTFSRNSRHTFAMMRRNLGFTAAALVTLALGIGATTAVFSVVYGVLLRPLAHPESERLVRLSEENPGAISPLREAMLSNLTYHAWNQGARTIDQFAAYATQQFTVTLPEGSVRIDGATVTPSLFTRSGAVPGRGRFFRADEGPSGACLLPARRAASTEPAEALRCE
jgi:putative ABC transport system permease protein